MKKLSTAVLAARLAQIQALVVDDDPAVRKLVKALLASMGVRTIHEAVDGAAGLDAVRSAAPDVIILDWEMPQMQGPEFMRTLRSPDTFPYPAVPVIMLTAHGEYSKVKEAVAVGVNEYLLKPVSSKALLDRLISVLFNPRPIIRKPNYYGPEPRKLSQTMGGADWQQDIVLL